MIITLLGYGFSDCEDITDVSTCNGKATVAKPLGNFSSLAGVPTVPLVTKTVFPPTGSALVVPNPNGGGEGVPISAWVNDNSGYTDPITGDTCDQDADAVLSSGSWNTCELQEWYERESVPANVACDQQSGCECTEDESLSYNHARQVLGIDIVKDSSFPCDLFHTFFNVKRVDYEFIKSTAQQLDDCSTLDDTSSGMYWVSGDSCHLGAEVVGSPGNPVVIVSAAASTSMNANFELYGLLYIFDGEVETAEFSGAGGATIYGALIVDAPTMKGFAGTINIVYARGVLLEAANIGGLGSINGGWRDFGLPEIDW